VLRQQTPKIRENPGRKLYREGQYRKFWSHRGEEDRGLSERSKEGRRARVIDTDIPNLQASLILELGNIALYYFLPSIELLYSNSAGNTFTTK